MMEWVRRLWRGAVYLLALYGAYGLGAVVVNRGMFLSEPTSCPGEIYELELNTVPDIYALGKLSAYVSGASHVYRMQLDVRVKGEYDPVLYVWMESSKVPDCGFRIKGLEIRQVRVKVPGSRKPVMFNESAYRKSY